MLLIADTGFIVALYDKGQPTQMKWARQWLQRASLPILTTILNLHEAAFLLDNHEGAMRIAAAGDFKLMLDFQDEADALHALLLKYAPRMDMTDAAIVRLSELHPAAKVLTVDRKDFSIYRRFRSEKIPCEFPPE
ncbi:MAG: PIN domain-containing protein [Verrucomicrobiota bacterium]